MRCVTPARTVNCTIACPLRPYALKSGKLSEVLLRRFKYSLSHRRRWSAILRNLLAHRRMPETVRTWLCRPRISQKVSKSPVKDQSGRDGASRHPDTTRGMVAAVEKHGEGNKPTMIEEPARSVDLPKATETKFVRMRWHVVAKQDESMALDCKRSELVRKIASDAPELFDGLREYATDRAVLRRFLTARDNDVNKAAKLLTQALEWRASRRPDVHDYSELEVEARTGKVRVAIEPDRWGRPIVIFDNTVQNTNDAEANMRFLAFNLEHALRRAKPPVEKYVIFMHLSDFSFSNNPSWSVTKETCSMLVACFPECCGHIIVYGAPRLFSIAFAAVKPLVDQTTATKIIFASHNDVRLDDIIGSRWRELTGAGQSRELPGSSPGYRHEISWLRTLQDELEWRKRTGNAGALHHKLLNWPGPDPLSLDPTRVFPGRYRSLVPEKPVLPPYPTEHAQPDAVAPPTPSAPPCLLPNTFLIIVLALFLLTLAAYTLLRMRMRTRNDLEVCMPVAFPEQSDPNLLFYSADAQDVEGYS